MRRQPRFKSEPLLWNVKLWYFITSLSLNSQFCLNCCPPFLEDWGRKSGGSINFRQLQTGVCTPCAFAKRSCSDCEGSKFIQSRQSLCHSLWLIEVHAEQRLTKMYRARRTKMDEIRCSNAVLDHVGQWNPCGKSGERHFWSLRRKYLIKWRNNYGL